MIVGMKTLYLNDVIKMGEYAGLTLRECIALYGRKSLLKVLKYYDIHKEILKDNHYHKVGDEEPIEEEMHANDSIMEETFEMTPSVDVDDLIEDYEEWVKEGGMWETSATDATYEDENYEYCEEEQWGMDWRRNLYEEDFLEMEDGYKPWIYGE